MSLINELQKIGLSDKEARVYLATLELGQATIANIATQSGIKRVTTYPVLQSLIDKGLCSTYNKDKKVYFIAESPETVLSVLHIQKKQIEEREQLIKGVMPQLKAIYNRQEDKPTVRFFEGMEGLRSMILEQQKSTDKEQFLVVPSDDLDKVFEVEERKVSYDVRVAQNKKVKMLYTRQQGSLEARNPGDEYILVPSHDFPISCDLAIFGNKIRIAALKGKLSGVIIDDENIATTLKSLFRLAWIGSQHLNKKK